MKTVVKGVLLAVIWMCAVYQGSAQGLSGVVEDTVGLNKAFVMDEGTNPQLRVSKQETALEQQAEEAAGISVYPNPMADVLNIVLPKNAIEAEVTIINTGGQVVHTQHIQADRPTVYFDPPKGVYVVMITDGDNFYAARRVVKR